MRPPARPGLWLVAAREIRFFRHDRAGYLLVVVVPLIAFAVLAWTFSSAVVRGLDVVIVDGDRSETSAKLIQSIAAAPGLRVAERADELKNATRATLSRSARAEIPIAVVDDDRTPLSRRLIQALDADEAISVAVRAPALDVAQQLTARFERRRKLAKLRQASRT